MNGGSVDRSGGGRGSGRIYRRGRGWWIAYRAEGHWVRESVARALGLAPERVTPLMAERLLERRLAALAPGRWLPGMIRRITVGEVLAAWRGELGVAAGLTIGVRGRVRRLPLGALLDRYLLTERARRARRGLRGQPL